MPKIRAATNTAAVTAIGERLSNTVQKTDAREKYWRFQPGVSGNPGGRSKVLAEILALGNKNSPAVMSRLIDAALNDPNPLVWIPAAREVLNRTFGKPNQQVEVVGGIDHKHFVLHAPPVIATAERWEQEYGEMIENEPDTNTEPDKA